MKKGSTFSGTRILSSSPFLVGSDISSMEEKLKIFPSSQFNTLARFVPEITHGRDNSIAMAWPKEGRKITYSELDQETERVALALSKENLSSGRHVGAFMLNSPEMVYIWLGVLRAGSVFVPFNNALKGELLDYQIRDSDVRILFVDDAMLDKLPERLIERSSNVVVIAIGRSRKVSRHIKQIQSFEEFCDNAGGRNEASFRKVLPEDPAMILYTSGTTGQPKGAVLPHFSFVNRVREIEGIVELRNDDVFYNVLPFFHTSGQVMTTLPALMNGLSVVQDSWFHTSTFWKYAMENRATISFVLMRMVNSLLQAGEVEDDNTLRAMMSGGVRRETLIQFEKRFGIRLLEGFGMTETCGISIFNTARRARIGSIGKPLPSIEVKLVDEEGHEIKQPEKTGEIHLKPKIADTFLLGYYNQPAQELFTKDGWLKTGDLAKSDKDGFYYYVERKKDLIRCREENISPSDIEKVAESHPSIVESAAIGVRTSEITRDEEILLAIKTREKLEPLELLSFLEQKLPFFMVPRYLLYLEEIPKTPNQKIRRQAIREIGLANAIDGTKIGFRAKRPNEY